MKDLKNAQVLIEKLISETPSGELRNKLSDINISLLLGIGEILDKNIEIIKILQK